MENNSSYNIMQKDLEENQKIIEELQKQNKKDRKIKIILIIIIILLLLFWLVAYRVGRIGYNYKEVSTNLVEDQEENISLIEITQEDLKITKNTRT
jgi:flagellar basal body-associated protein FliL